MVNNGQSRASLRTSVVSISFTYDPEKQIVYGVMVDTFTWDEYEAVVGEIAKSDNFRPDVGSLWDMRRFDFNSLDREMEEHAVGIRERFPARARGWRCWSTTSTGSRCCGCTRCSRSDCPR
jgi:hypothetical protein